VLHFILLAAALAALPIIPSDSWKPGGGGHPILQIVLLLGANLGLPYFVLSATGPLMQHWLTRTHAGARPYRLYALSNAGSLLALLSFPFYFETHFTRKAQAAFWDWGLAVYALCCGFCATKLWRSEGRPVNVEASPGEESSKIQAPSSREAPNFKPETNRVPGLKFGGWSFSGVWRLMLEVFGFRFTKLTEAKSNGTALDTILRLLLPACASVLLLATTNKLCQDVAVIPLLWVLPLAIYLLSFIICFDSPKWYAYFPSTLALLGGLLWACWMLVKGNDMSIRAQIMGYSAALFLCCMVCHGELYRRRPDARRLTAFYMLIAAGGALGGVFVAVVAPFVFTDFYELHWGLLLCGVLFVLVRWTELARGIYRSILCGCLALCVSTLGVVLWKHGRESGSEVVYKSRNFYGVLTVYDQRRDQPKDHHLLLQHGRITHGLQFVDPEQAAWPTTYYGEESGIGLAMKALLGSGRRIGLVGLGTGTLAAYARPGDYVRIYEINPAVKELATTRFTYLSHCQGTVEVVPGDARLSMQKEPPQRFDLLALDAFSGDAIPVHLLTSEAMTIYQRHLNTNGIIAVHISNHYLDLEPVVIKLARHFDYNYVAIDYDDSDEEWWLYSSTWILLSADGALLNTPAIRSAANPVKIKPIQLPLWTDDFASLYQILK
jgi:hypothetical protein